MSLPNCDYNSVRLVLLLVAIGLFAPTSAAQAEEKPPPSATRGVEVVNEGPSPQLGYRAAWAVIVGVNYRHLHGADAAEIPPLGTAENDAQAVYDHLTKDYGFAPDHVRLLLGKVATRQAIEDCFGNSFLGDNQQVKPDDCVLFYFAGHGNRREKSAAAEQFVGLLYPADVRILPGKGADTITCLRIDDLLRYLQDYCAARHKLVILDSCHSGEIFNFRVGRGGGVNRGFKPELLERPTFQAIAAARASQVASDAQRGGTHSPFTTILLEALEKGPFSDQQRVFSASELFAYVPHRMAELDDTKQDPQGGWLSGEGDFYFFPINARLPAARAVAPQEIARTDSNVGAPATAKPTSGPSTPAVWIAAALLLAAGGGIVLWQRTRVRLVGNRGGAATARPPSNSNAAAVDKVLLRVVGTPYSYLARAGAAKLTVGRQRRKPGDPLDEGNDFVIRVPESQEQSLQISRRHLEIEHAAQGWFVIDRSRAGTQLDGKRLTKDRPAPLHSGSRLMLAGVLELEFLVQTDFPPMAVQPIVNLPLRAAGMPIEMEASVGDMVTAEPKAWTGGAV